MGLLSIASTLPASAAFGARTTTPTLIDAGVTVSRMLEVEMGGPSVGEREVASARLNLARSNDSMSPLILKEHRTASFCSPDGSDGIGVGGEGGGEGEGRGGAGGGEGGGDGGGKGGEGGEG